MGNDLHFYDNHGNHTGRASGGPTALDPEGFFEFFGMLLITLVVLGFLAVGVIYVILWLLGNMF